ncbi:MAG: alpha/beta hydrolase [Candidatus Saccharibacteria bacterium]
MNSHHNLDKTAYWVYNDNPKLPVIIMIHGFRGTHHGLELIAEQLDKYRIIIPDLPGFGETEPLTSDHSLGSYVNWLNDFIVGLNLTELPILLGHSFGSIIASGYTSKYPNTIAKLVLVNPIGAPALEGPRAIMTQLAILYYWLGYKLPEPIAAKWLSSKTVVQIMSTVMTKTRDKDTKKYINHQHLEHFSSFTNRKVVSEAFQASVQNNVRTAASDITVPTLLIAGDRDDITPLSKQRELVTLFPNAKLKVIKNVGHLTHYETPDQVASAIKKFID